LDFRKQPLDEIEILEEIKNMDNEQLKEFRRKNREHEDKIAQRTFRNLYSRFVKRLIDFVAGVFGTVALVPITLFVIILRIIYNERGPIFYKQERIGKDGKIFCIHKFRSMIENADEALKQYLEKNPDEAKEFEINRKLKNDPRVTRTGAFLRETSLDEWPQFVDVLIGKMSLVGPRPYLVSEKEAMGEYYKYIIKVKPGITGPWQVAGRSNLTFEDRLKLDEEYYSRCGNRRDFIIFLKTFKKVFKREGAV